MTALRIHSVCIFAALLIGCVSELPVLAPPDGLAARDHISRLSEGIGRRLAGTPEEALGADYVESALTEIGYTPIRQTFMFSPEDRPGGTGLESANIVAVKPGQAAREIIVGAHYDSETLGRGAGDNASGVAVMLEAAAAIHGVTTPYTVRFVAFGAEEQGFRGSRHFVEGMTPDAMESTVVMINLDSLVTGDLAYVYGDAGEAGVLRDWLLASAREEGLPLETQAGDNPDYPAGTTGDFSDHVPFREAGIPYAYFESTNWSLGELDGYTQVDPQFGEDGEIWHTRFDTLDYIEETFPGRIDARLALFSRMLYRALTEFTAP